MTNSSAFPQFQYLPADATTPAQLLQELWQHVEPSELHYYLKYISRALVASDEFCEQPAAFRGTIMWFLDLMEDFANRSNQIIHLQSSQL